MATIPKIVIDPEENIEIFDVVIHRRRCRYQEIYGKLYEVEYSPLALEFLKKIKAEKKKEEYRTAHPKKEKMYAGLSYYQKQKMKSLDVKAHFDSKEN